MPGWAGNSCFFSRFYGGSEALFFFFLLANPGIRAYFDFDAEADGQKRAKSSTSSQNRLSFRAGRAKCKGWLFEKEKNRETCHDLVSLARTAYWLYNIGIE